MASRSLGRFNWVLYLEGIIIFLNWTCFVLHTEWSRWLCYALLKWMPTELSSRQSAFLHFHFSALPSFLEEIALLPAELSSAVCSDEQRVGDVPIKNGNHVWSFCDFPSPQNQENARQKIADADSVLDYQVLEAALGKLVPKQRN